MKKTWLAVFIASMFCASNAWAGTVTPVSGIGTRAKAMGGAGTAVAEGASMFYYNPALLAGSEDMVEAGMDYTNVSIKYEDPTGAEHKSNPGEYFIPLIGVTGDIGKFKAGVALVTPNAFGSDFKEELDMYSKLSLTNITPAIACKLTDNLSIGASASVGYGMVDLTLPAMPGISTVDWEASGFGYSYQFGVLYAPADWLTIGSSYQSKTRVELDGNVALKSSSVNMEDDFSTVFYFPGRAHFGVGIKPTEKLLIAADATYMDYSSTRRVDFDYDTWSDNSLRLDWKSHWVYGVGAEYAATDNLKLRSGMSYQEKAIADSAVNPVTPDTSGGLAASLGFGWKKGDLGIDAAYVHAWGLDREVPLPNPGAGRYSANINIVSAAASYRW